MSEGEAGTVRGKEGRESDNKLGRESGVKEGM